MEEEDVMLPPRMIHDRLRRWRRLWRLFAVASTIILIDLFPSMLSLSREEEESLYVAADSSSVSIEHLTSCP